jgi:protein-tyrosine phosphatase
MTVAVTLPGGITFRAGGAPGRDEEQQPDWGVYADACWDNWPGVLLDWPDFGLPGNDDQVFDAIRQAFARARRGEDVIIGCRGGTGRTGTILACLAILGSVPPEFAVAWVRGRYRASAVETVQQEKWITQRFAILQWVRDASAKSRHDLIDASRKRLRNEMEAAFNEPDGSPILAWAIHDVLAVTQRPLRVHPIYGGGRRDYPSEARSELHEWVRRLVENHRIRSVIVLTSNVELAHYTAPTTEEGGLLALYRQRGLAVEHFPADDPAHDVRAKHAFDAAVDTIADRVAEALRRLPHPAVLHCSAAIDRSPPVAARVAFLHEVNALALEG